MLIIICLKLIENHYSKYQWIECLRQKNKTKQISAFEGLANHNFYNKVCIQRPWNLFLQIFKKLRKELNTLSEDSSNGILGLILKFYNCLYLWEESSLDETLAFSLINLYSDLKWNEFKACNFIAYVFGKKFKIIQKIDNLFNKFCLKIFIEATYFGGKRINVKIFGLKYFHMFTCRQNIFTIKNYICREESIEGIDNFKLINHKN